MSVELLTMPSVVMEDPPVTYLDASCNGLELSPEEYDAITDYDEDYRYELIHGVVIVNPIPLEGETSPNDQLGFLIREYQQRHPRGSAVDETIFERYIFLPDGSRRRADRVIWAGLGRLPKPKSDMPTIVVEFVSRAKRDQHRDYVVKRREYLAAGVKEYWIIDRFRGTMTVCRGDAEIIIRRGGQYTTPLLPEFLLPLDALLSVADRWQDADA
jgi:Uma2 family endonuclease